MNRLIRCGTHEKLCEGAVAAAAPTAGDIGRVSAHGRQIKALVEHFAKYSRLNGAILVSVNDHFIFSGEVGMANTEWQNPSTVDTWYLLASVRKQFTAAAILRLVARLGSATLTRLPSSRYARYICR
ncbi:MAG: serine hydrolase [Telluria sp.]